jgi:SAM-dependent methyltransferase
MSQYLHGYTKEEQDRLFYQAYFLEPYVYDGVDLEFKKDLLEVGCGVGAQTQVLLRRFPDINIHGVDISDKQLSVAKLVHKESLREGRVKFSKQDAQNLKLDHKYDSAFLCWFLEHVPDPLKVLKSTRKFLKKGSKIYCTEVFNQTLFMDPYCPHYLKYWFEFNDYQWAIKGHPFVGAKLGHLLTEAGFTDVKTEVRPFHYDSREPEKRAAFVEEFYKILLSAQDVLLKEKRVTQKDIVEMKKEVARVKKAKDAVFFYAFIRATARVS